MLVVVGLFLPLLVAAQETTADSASVESLPLRADVSTNELSDAVLKLVNPANTPGITVEIQRYQQEVTLKSTLRNVDDAIEDSRWQSNVIDAARSVDLGDGTADDVVWDWARSTPITRLDPNTVVVKFVMTWTPEDSRWRHTTAVRILRESDFTTKFATEIRDREAAGGADTTEQTPVITTVSIAYAACSPSHPPASLPARLSGWLTEADNGAAQHRFRCRSMLRFQISNRLCPFDSTRRHLRQDLMRPWTRSSLEMIQGLVVLS
jgi:hypothetical protein